MVTALSIWGVGHRMSHPPDSPMKKLDVPQSGSQASTVASRNRFGQYNRTRAMPIQPRTDLQVAVRAALAAASQAWRGLTDAVRAAWATYSDSTPTLDSLGQTIFPSGHQRFVGLWLSHVQAGLVLPAAIPSAAPPAAPVIGDVTLAAAGAGDAAVTGALSATLVMIVSCSPQVSPGISFNGDYRFLQSFTALAAGLVDFSAAYIARWGVPVTGRKVFFRFRLVSTTGGVSAPTDVPVIVG